jgi:hypothetical protein
MAVLNYLAAIDALQPAALTVLAQALPPTDQGMLLWDTLAPREDVPSVLLSDVTTLDYRPAADRREWNTSGRLIPMVTPATRLVEIVPIEARDRIAEKEMQRIAETAQGNANAIREIIGNDIPRRVARLVDADYRRLEVDFFTAWINGNIVQRNPETGATFTASFGFPAARYTTAGTAWDNVGVNAYDLFLAWVAAAQDLVGPIKGAMLRQATYSAILTDAPNLQNSVKMTRSQLESRVSDDLGNPFNFFINENSLDVFDDGGTSYTRTKVFPAQRIAAIPADGTVGRTKFAPVVRAMELAPQVPASAGIDIRGVTVYYDEGAVGKDLQIEAQLNALPVPQESKLYVTNTGV